MDNNSFASLAAGKDSTWTARPQKKAGGYTSNRIEYAAKFERLLNELFCVASCGLAKIGSTTVQTITAVSVAML